MRIIAKLLLCLGVWWVHATNATSSIRLYPKPEIYPSPEEAKSSLGTVFGAKQCGGPGEFVEWRIEGCETTESTCQLHADDSLRHSEIDFKTSQSLPKLGLRVTVKYPDTDTFTILDVAIPNSNVTAGSLQTLRVAGHIDEDEKGKTVTGQMIVYNWATNVTEVCGEAMYEFI